MLIFHLIAKKDKEIWVRYGNTDAVAFGQKELEREDIPICNVHDLKRLIKDKLRSFLKDVSEEVISLHKGGNNLKSSTTIIDLFNTGNEALEIIIIGEKGMYKMVASEYTVHSYF